MSVYSGCPILLVNSYEQVQAVYRSVRGSLSLDARSAIEAQFAPLTGHITRLDECVKTIAGLDNSLEDALQVLQLPRVSHHLTFTCTPHR